MYCLSHIVKRIQQIEGRSVDPDVEMLEAHYASSGSMLFANSTTVKPAYAVTSIKGSPVLSSHLFWVP